MEKYIAFLRGINVGGHNKVSMSELKRHLEQNDFHEVVTYINSGNLLFSSALNDESELSVKFEAIILEVFELKISVLILSLDRKSVV